MKPIYEAFDGKRFDTAEECMEYESMEGIQFFDKDGNKLSERVFNELEEFPPYAALSTQSTMQNVIRYMEDFNANIDYDPNERLYVYDDMTECYLPVRGLLDMAERYKRLYSRVTEMNLL